MIKIKVLGTTYTVIFKTPIEYPLLNDCHGYCDFTSKKIVIGRKPKDNELEIWEKEIQRIIRHEIIHAFLSESGLRSNWEHTEWGHDETFIDWFAIQYPKIVECVECCMRELWEEIKND